MRIKALMYALLPLLICVSIGSVTAQDSAPLSYEDSVRIDSLVNAYHVQERKTGNDQATKNQQRKNSENLSDMKTNRDETRAKAREAQRVEREANDAAREARLAYRTEKKAQKVRMKADKQAKKAAKARTIADEN